MYFLCFAVLQKNKKIETNKSFRFQGFQVFNNSLKKKLKN